MNTEPITLPLIACISKLDASGVLYFYELVLGAICTKSYYSRSVVVVVMFGVELLMLLLSLSLLTTHERRGVVY